MTNQFVSIKPWQLQMRGNLYMGPQFRVQCTLIIRVPKSDENSMKMVLRIVMNLTSACAI